ncbi:hypothetical protein JW911_02890 [Candidatus Peregrinibacteria bacterium]|nr:hypothetical protein [Candidatus Peregrinibacteria bacterium]
MFENRSKQISIMIIVLILAGAAFYFIWNVLLNTGTVVFEYSKPPFTVTIDDKSQTCFDNGCEFSLPAGPRSYIVKKDGYYEESGSIIIKRGDRQVVGLSLEFIPQTLSGTEFKGLKLPAGYSKFSDNLKEISLFVEFPADFIPKRLPKIIDEFVFAKSGKSALIFENGTVSLYSFSDFSLKTLNGLKGADTAIFSADENSVYTIAYDEALKKYALKKLDLKNPDESENLIYFTRDVTDYKIKISPDETYMALLDKTFTPEILYTIDLANRTRKNIFEGYTIEAGQWSEDGRVFVFKGKTESDMTQSFYYYDTMPEVLNRLQFEGDIRNFDFNLNNAYFITSTSYSVISFDFPYMIKFNPQQQVSDYASIFEDASKEKNIILVKWGLKENEFYLVQDMTGLLETEPKQLELNPEDNTLRLLSDSQFFEVKVGE